MYAIETPKGVFIKKIIGAIGVSEMAIFLKDIYLKKKEPCLCKALCFVYAFAATAASSAAEAAAASAAALCAARASVILLDSSL